MAHSPIVPSPIALPTGTVVAVADLAGLRWLSGLATNADYLAQADGPYKVGDLADKAALTRPIKIAHTICVLADDDAADIARARAKLRGDFPDEGQRAIIGDILAIDDALGFRRSIAAITFDQRPVPPGKAQRGASGAWHHDTPAANGYEKRDGNRFTRRYTVCSTAGTLFLREQASRTAAAWDGGAFPANGAEIKEREAEARAKGYIVEAAPYEVWLMPPRTWHRGQIMPAGGARAFLRVTCFG